MLILKFLILLLILNNYFVNGLINNNEKISKLLNDKVLYNDEAESNDIPKLWIFFNSKDISIKKNGYFFDNESGRELTFDQVQSETGITDQSLERRFRRTDKKNQLLYGNHNGNINKSSKQKLLLDESDLPVCQKFINEILQCSSDSNKIQLVQKSKWMNSISISITPSRFSINENGLKQYNINDVVSCIAYKPFVTMVDVVSKFKKETIFHQSNDNHQQHTNKNIEIIESNDNNNNNNNNYDKFGNNLKNLKLLKLDNDKKIFDQTFYGNTFDAISQVGIDKLQSLGYDGYGVNILMLDSGFYKDHEAFSQMKIIAEHNFIDNTTNTQGPMDDSQNNHGTATLSTIGGYVPGLLVGAAYNASFLLGKTEVVSSESMIEEDYWIAGLEWGEGLGADMVSSSLGYTLWYNYYDLNAERSHITRVADYATSKGMVVVVSAGNSGNSGIGAPADGKYVISVGAINGTGVNTGFSSVGPSTDGRVKPDVMGLGYKNFVASYHGKSNYTNMSGTSFACPLVASGIALLIQAHPDWSNKQIYEAVLGSASLSSDPNIKMGFGILNAFEAYRFNPTAQTCDEIGCSGHGGCCNGKCTCAPDYYGEFCQYRRVECSKECTQRHGKCQYDKFGLSFVCVDPNNTETSQVDPRDQCSICTGCSYDLCGVCGGQNQCLINKQGCSFYDSHLRQCKSIIVEQQEENDSNQKSKLIVGVSVGLIGGIILIVFSVIIIKKKKSIIFPFLKGYEELNNQEIEE